MKTIKTIILVLPFFLLSNASFSTGYLYLRVSDSTPTGNYTVEVRLYYDGNYQQLYSVPTTSIDLGDNEIKLPGVPYDITPNLYFYQIMIVENGILRETAVINPPGLFNTYYYNNNNFYHTSSF